jgi:hypothetical protein
LLESSRWLSLKDNADRLAYLALLLKADAFGNFTADPWRLRRLWSDFGIVNDQAVAKTLAELVDHDLVRMYTEDGNRYLHIPRYRQRLRYTKRRSAPASPWCDREENQQHAEHSPGAHPSVTGRSPGAHRRRKEGSEGSEVKEEKDAREQPVDNSAQLATVTHALASKLKTNGNNGGWWKTADGIAAKGKALGIEGKVGETLEAYKDRLFRADRERA